MKDMIGYFIGFVLAAFLLLLFLKAIGFFN